MSESDRRRKMVILSSAEDDAVQERAAAQGVSWAEYVRGLIRAALEAEGASIPYVEVEQRQPPPKEDTREQRRRRAANLIGVHERGLATLEAQLAATPWDTKLQKRIAHMRQKIERERQRMESI